MRVLKVQLFLQKENWQH